MPQQDREIRVAVIGLGFMGATHLNAYRDANEAGNPNRLVAVCDADPGRRAGQLGGSGNITTGAEGKPLFDPAVVRGYEQVSDLLPDSEVELVSICTPTDSHVDLAIAALQAGKHVLLEKPVALHSQEIERLLQASNDAKTLCMPAHCIRFWPAYAWLSEQVRNKTCGNVQSAVFRRLSTPPSWSADFYTNLERTGGALTDLHIHDSDFILGCFGQPSAVSSTGNPHHVTSLYHFDREALESGITPLCHVTAEGGWDHSAGYPFQMSFTVIFEQATVDFALDKQPNLRLYRNGAEEPLELPATTGYDEEVRHILNAIRSGAKETAVTLSDALFTARLLEAERASQTQGGTRIELS